VTEAVRPYRATSPAKDTAAAAFFREVAAAGPTVVLYPPLDPAGARRLQDEPAFADPAERDATELLLWLEAGDVRRARKVLRRAATTGLGPLVPHLVALSHPRDARALDLVWESTSEDLVRRDIARGLEALDATRTAWLAWAELVRAPDPEIRVEAFLAVRRLQPPAQPAALQDPIGNQSWFPPEHLLGWARDAAAQTDRGAADDPRLLRIDAIAAFEAGQDAEAEVRLARAQRVDDDPELAVWRARVAARTRVDTGETLEAVRAAVAAAPYDPDVLAAAAALLTEVEAHGLALEHAVAAARLAFDEAPRWLAVVDLALRVGDLTTATAAARRASDLDRADPALATTLAELARLAGDLDSATVAATRLGRAPPRGASEELDALLADLPADRLLAVLNHHDDAVRASPRALALRAQLRLELGALDEAAGDGLLLAERHGDPRGTAIAFSATAGRVWSSGLEEALDAHADNGQVGRTRLHWAVVTGARDPERVVGNVEDPHADAIRAWLRDADAAAATAPGWPSEGLPEPESAAPRGMRANRFLGLGTGVLGFSDPSTATSTLITARPIRGVPPPLSLLATPHEPAVRTMAGGGRIVRLDGLEMPVYAAFKVRGELGVTGIGFTPDAAERAARAALGEE
jgi:hypothetical protein